MVREKAHPFIDALIMEIVDDPTDLGYKAGNGDWKTDAAIHGFLTARIATQGEIAAGDLVQYLAATGILAKIVDDSENPSSPTRSASMGALKATENDALQIDLGDPVNVAMLGAFRDVTAIITSDQYDEIMALATITICRVDQLGFRVNAFTQDGVARARELYDEAPEEWPPTPVSASASASA
jgi:hypothetical protein